MTAVHTARSRPERRTRDDAGFSRVEIAVALSLIAVLALVISFTLSSASQAAVRTACASDVSAVDTAAATFASEHAAGTQVTASALVASGGGTLAAWPRIADHAYVILIAGDGNAWAGARDARGLRIERNDVLVQVGHRVFDATRSFAAACVAA